MTLKFIGQTFAESELTCVNAFSKKPKPFVIVKAKIIDDDIIDHVQFEFKDYFFSTYFEDNTTNGKINKSSLVNPEGRFQAKINESIHSPYKGYNEFLFLKWEKLSE